MEAKTQRKSHVNFDRHFDRSGGRFGGHVWAISGPFLALGLRAAGPLKTCIWLRFRQKCIGIYKVLAPFCYQNIGLAEVRFQKTQPNAAFWGVQERKTRWGRHFFWRVLAPL